MTDPIMVTIAPEPTRVRMLVTRNDCDILKAVLAPATTTHFRAASTLLEGLSLWYQQPLSVVLCADEQGASSALGLCDALGFGERRLYFDVGIAAGANAQRRHRPRSGLGDFRDLRHLSFGEVIR